MAREWISEPCLLGIDEAGRGPVLGPMVYGCAYCPIARKEQLTSMHFADSKTLTEAKREEIFESIKSDSLMGWAVDVIDPRDLSAQMLRRERRSLNAISYESAMGLINSALNKGVNLTEVFVDTVGDAEKYQASLAERFPQINFTVSKKADSLFPIVSAASIVAKVTRDRSLRDWKFDETLSTLSRDFGSGYPADPETKAWLLQSKDAVFGFPSLVRFSWATCKPLISAGGVEVFWEADEGDETSGKRKSQTVEAESSAISRHPYFGSRKLQQVTTRL